MDLHVQKREKLGKAVKALRRDGFIPAELYGRGVENAHLSVGAKDFNKILKEAGTSTVVNVVLGGKKTPVLIQDVDRNYLTGDVEHADFYAVRMDEKIKAKVPLEFVGVSAAVKDKGGILNKVMSEIEVEALPADLPHELKADLSGLDDLNKSIYVRDIAAPDKVRLLVDAETVVATVSPPIVEEVKVEASVDVSAVKVETEEKKVERVRLAEASGEGKAAEKTGKTEEKKAK